MPKIVNQREVAKNSTQVLAARVRRKGMTTAYIMPFLVFYGKKSGKKSKVYTQFANAYYCSNFQEVRDGKLVTKCLCKTRMCQKCAAIRTANFINGYEPQLRPLMSSKKLYFATLTTPTVHFTQAKKQLESLSRAFTKILAAARQQAFKGKRKKFKALRKLEFTVRPNGRIHFHYHILVEGKENANFLVQQWLKKNPTAKSAAQDVRLATPGSLKEMFKYITKPSTKIDGKVHHFPSDSESIEATNAAYEACKGRRLLQPFGGLKKVSEEINEEDFVAVDLKKFAGTSFRWVREIGNYVSDYDEILSPKVTYPKEVRKMLESSFHPPPQLIFGEEKRVYLVA